MINYIIVGLDDSGLLDEAAIHYEQLFRESDMRYVRLNIGTWNEFVSFWTTMKKDHYGNVTSTLDYYRSVDNLIIICHGNGSGINIDPSGGAEGISVNDWPLLASCQSADVNVIEYMSCHSAYNHDGNFNTAYNAIEYCSVDETYGWDGYSFFSPDNDMNYYDWPWSSGFIRYSKNENGTITCSVMPIVSIGYIGNVAPAVAAYVDSNLHSTESSGE